MKKILFAIFIICTKLVNAQTTICFSPAVNYGAGSSPYSVCAADFNNDGKPDMACANYGTNNVSVFINSGTGTFGAATNFGTGTGANAVTSADFDKDGNMDLAVANFNVSSVSILLGNGSGGFTLWVNKTVGTNPEGITVADFNGDGKIDIATANKGGNNVSILLNTGGGNFGGATNIGTGTGPYSICSGDFNNDNKPDLACANNGASDVSILIGTGTGTFSLWANIATGANPASVVSGDFNADGNIDLITGNLTAANISVFLGQGTGNFGAATNLPLGSSPFCICTGDFNMDGKLDVASANSSGSSVSVAVGNGLGSFSPVGSFSVGNNPYAVCSADFNGDAKADIAAGNDNSSSNNVSVLLNNLPVISTSGNTSICAGDTAIFSVSGANTFTWTPTTVVKNTSVSSETVMATPTVNTTYTVTGNNSGCSVTATATINVTVNPIPTLTIANTASLGVCSGTTNTITASGASSYVWNTGDVTGAIIVSPTSNTGYTVTGTSMFGCVGTASTSILVYPNPTPPLTVNSPTICVSSSATLTASGVSTYTWSTTETGATINPSPTGNTSYTVTGTDANGCEHVAVSDVTVNQLPNVQINGVNNGFNFICAGSSIILNASGANTYTWSTTVQATHITVTPINGDLYGVTGTDGNGCTNSTSTSFSVHALPNVTVNSAVVCIGTTATLTANGANTYTWSNSNTTNSIVVTPTVNTSYTVTGTDANTCTNTAVASVSAPANPAPNICMVTTDSASVYNYNIVYWDKTLYQNADSFIVYRFDAFSSSYLRLGAVSKDSLSAYKDTSRHVGAGGVHNGDPNYTSWRYKLAVRDTCGNVSALSPYHETVFLQNQNNGNFNVSQYVIEAGQTNPVTGYYLFRDDLGSNNFQLLIPITGTSATDPAYTSYPNANYRVDILGFNCNPTLRLAGGNNTYAAKQRSHSNINNNRTSGINKVAATKAVKVYPNPASNNIVIEAGAELGVVAIYNALGEVVMQLTTKNMQEQIDISKLAPGVYTIEAKNSFTKLIKE